MKKYIKILYKKRCSNGNSYPDGVILNKWYEVINDSVGSYDFKNEDGANRIVFKTDTSMYEICEGHPYAELIQYAADRAREDINVGQHFQVKNGDKWEDLGSKFVPIFNPSDEYRIKPKTIKIGDTEINAPEREALEDGQKYYALNLYQVFYPSIWENDSYDKKRLGCGMIFLNKADAIAASEAILELLKGGE